MEVFDEDYSMLDLSKKDLLLLIRNLNEHSIDIVCLIYLILNNKYLITDDILAIKDKKDVYTILLDKFQFMGIASPSKSEYEYEIYIVEKYVTNLEYSKINDLKCGCFYPHLIESTCKFLFDNITPFLSNDYQKYILLSSFCKGILNEAISENLNGEIFKINDTKNNYTTEI